MPVSRKSPVPVPHVITLSDADARLEGMIVIHSAALGLAAGGCRLWAYPGLDEVFTDAVRLAEGMSYKNALAGLPFGGAKAVIREPQAPYDRRALFDAFARAVERLEGRYVTAQDVGSYKPNLAHFHVGLEKLAAQGVPKAKVLHVAQSLFHDHVPAKQVGLPSVWINRRGGTGSEGATPQADAVRPDLEVPSMAAFVERVRRQAAL